MPYGQDPYGRPRSLHPDQQVWPPAQRGESVGSSTQPIPAIHPSMPLPQRRPHAQQPQQPHPQQPHIQQPHVQQPPQAGPPQNPQPSADQSAPPTPQEDAPADPQDAAAQPPARRRMLLVGAAAVAACLITVGANAYDGYLFYEKTTTKETREIAVAAGQAGKVYNIEWKATVAPMPAPAGTKHGPEVTWLKVDVSQKLLDEANATMIGAPDEVRLKDRAGRSWVVELQTDGRPTDRLELGKEYKIPGVAIVPAAVANEVELSFRPSGYRSDTPTAELFKRGDAVKPDVDVLRFRRR
ncbi:hypothetical protein HII36_15045 [Nonomuraea sp. NN258]|uniref:hypothetical protein n=1 Tax=Nonomuraea antri TaxID=2730852 RepID=UPI001568AED6|nr:hypothetical protein [Nonomuraea antri]NRQ33149.1 hypothetical protein [Nonomuraea antri]